MTRGSSPNVDPARGQTPQDFMLGMGLFIITVVFVYAFIPTALSFTAADPGPMEAKQASRASAELINNLSVGEHQYTLNTSATGDFFNTTETPEQTRIALELPLTANVNVTLRSLDDGEIVSVVDSTGTNVRLVSGNEYRENQPAAEVVRVVQIQDQDNDCDPACQLIVRVW